MKAFYHADFVRALFQSKDVFGLYQLFVTLGRDRELPTSCLLFDSVLVWISSTRSGVWTYYEATSISEQQALFNSLAQHETLSFLAEQYRFGMENWQTENRLIGLDCWLDENEKRIHQLLKATVEKDKELVVQLATG